MFSLLKITHFLNKELGINKIPDTSKNGLQVNSNKEIKKIGFTVDASLEAFKKAKKLGCDLIIVHHGLLWKGKRKDDLLKKRIGYLKKNKISLYAVHAPLDVHIKYGNNAELAKIIDAKNLKKFGLHHKVNWGYWGLVKPTTLRKIAKKYNDKLGTSCFILNFGKAMIKKVGFCSGNAGFAIDEAKKKNLDLFVIGEIGHIDYHHVQELGLNLIELGHYKSEIVGVKALQELIKERFKINAVFIDIPTSL